MDLRDAPSNAGFSCYNSNTLLDKDEIIKLNKKEKKTTAQRGRGRGRGASVRGVRGGVGRGQSPVKGRGPNMYNRMMRGQLKRGRGGRGQRRGNQGRGGARGGLNRQNSGISPLNRSTSSLSPASSKRGRGRGGRGRARGRGSLRGRGASMTQRIQNKPAGVTSLNQRRQKAIETLIKAKSTLAQLNAQRRKTQRLTLVNQKRGLQGSNLNRSFGSTLSLKSTSSQKRRNFGSTISLNSTTSRGTGRLSRYGSTISLSSNTSSGSRNRGRRWRKPQAPQDDSPILTISVNNPVSATPPSPVRRGRGRGGARGGARGGRKNFLKRLPVETTDSDPVLAAQIANLRPAVSQKYNFKKAVFAQGHTSLSLNDRFGAGAGEVTGSISQEGRKVFF